MKRETETIASYPRAVRYAIVVLRFIGATLRVAFRLFVVFLKTAFIVAL